MTTPALVSIVIPTYNDDPAHLAEAVASAQAQTYPELEIVVIDDGSTQPATIAAVDALAGVRVVRQENQGPAAARNAGIRMGGGELIYPLDADDWIEPDVISLLASALTREDVVIAYPVVEMFGALGGKTHAPSECTLTNLLLVNRIVAASMYRREHWELAGGYAEGRNFQEDWVLWATVLGRTRGRAIRVDNAVMHYRQHDSSRNAQQVRQGARIVARRMIAEALPDRRADLLEAATSQLDQLMDELADARLDASRWRRIEPVMRPGVEAWRLVGRVAKLSAKGRSRLVRRGAEVP